MRYCASIIIPEGIFDMSLSQLDMFATQTRVLYHHIAFEHWQNCTKKREQIGKIRNVLSFFLIVLTRARICATMSAIGCTNKKEKERSDV